MPLICFASPKGGVGKTTLSANVASELARLGAPVVAIDLDPQSALGLHFGLSLMDAGGFGAGTAGQSDPSSWRRSLQRTDSGVGVLTHGHSKLAVDVARSAALASQPELLAAPVRDLLADPNTIVVADLPPGPSSAMLALLPLTDLLVTVLMVDAASLSRIPFIESGQVYGDLPERFLAEDRMVFALNQYDIRSRLGRASCEAAVRHFGRRLLGVIYRDELVQEAIASQQLVASYARNSKAASDMAALARAIAGRLAQSDSATAPQHGAFATQGRR